MSVVHGYKYVWRLWVLHAGMFVCFLGLLGYLWTMQVLGRERYQQDLTRQIVRRVRIPGTRGRIFDCQGRYLADNRPSYNIVLHLEELRKPGRWSNTVDHVDSLLEELSRVLELPRQISKTDIWAHVRRRLPLPLVAWRDIDEIALARWAELATAYPAVDVQVDSVRTYPFGSLACHAIGYVGRASPDDLAREGAEPYHYYLPETIGRAGIEKEFDSFLRGQPGGRLVRVDVSGFRSGDVALRPAQAGLDLVLTIDTRVQGIVERVLQGRRAAAVVVDPQNGDILALVSCPGFDLNLFAPSVSASVWEQLRSDPEKPLFNRALAGTYAPGSTFKPIVALAALSNNKATPATSFFCPGYFLLGNTRFNCWLPRGHGTVDMAGAIEHSCNVYFFRLGLQCGWEAVYHMAAALGLGRETGISIGYEASGLLPDNAWKRRTQGDVWRDGDTCNVSIGQGALLVTPIQMAMFVAAIANGGRLFRPRIVKEVRNSAGEKVREFPVVLANRLAWDPSHIRVIQEGMRRVIESPYGTGRLAAVPGLEAAGKTGTAEYGRKEEGKKIGWMIAYAPYDRPNTALAIMVEDVVSGGATVAPLVKEIWTELYGPVLEKTR